ncbi:hypothetical protein MRX96_003803 [Rhipicephalus microplus]
MAMPPRQQPVLPALDLCGADLRVGRDVDYAGVGLRERHDERRTPTFLLLQLVRGKHVRNKPLMTTANRREPARGFVGKLTHELSFCACNANSSGPAAYLLPQTHHKTKEKIFI